MLTFTRGIICLIGLLGATRARAAVFYDNTGPTAFGGAFRTGDEIADDVPFTGAQTVTGFSIFYHADSPVNATFRFTTVNQTTGGVGTTVAAFTASNLAAGDHVFTMSLAPAQQFTWTATPGIYHFAPPAGSSAFASPPRAAATRGRRRDGRRPAAIAWTASTT